MGKFRALFYLVLLFGFSLAPRAYAHHGYAAYHLTKSVTVTGTVTELSLANPHSSVTFDVKDEKGDVNLGRRVRYAKKFNEPRMDKRYPQAWRRN